MDFKRFDSIDAFRGLTVAAMLLVNNAGDWSYVYPWLEHATWHGCTLADFIFPFFLVIVGVSLELAYAPKLAQGVDRIGLLRAGWWRAFKIIAVGIVLHLIAMALIPDRHFRLFGVLQRIGICFGLAATIVLFLPSTKRIVIVLGVILLSYWALLSLGGGYEAHVNLVDRLDTAVLGPWAYQFDPLSLRAQEPEGILSTIGALASVLFGVLAGRMLRRTQLKMLLISAFALLLIGFVWQFFMPWNKQLWTSSFVCWTSGWALIAIALSHALVDRWRLPAIGISFGQNAIVAYAIAWVLTCILAATNAMVYFYPEVFAHGIGQYTSLQFASFSFAFCFTLLMGAWMLILRGQKIRIRL